MATKYHGLPDIDTAPDVFETPDVAEPVLQPSENVLGKDDLPAKPSNGGIDSSMLPDRRKAERVFGRGTRRPDLKNLPFRPRLPPHPNARASSSTSSASDSEAEYTQSRMPRRKESAVARIRRLKAELSELEQEVLHPQPVVEGEGRIKRKSVLPPKEPLDLMSEVAGLRERLMVLDEGDIPLGTGSGGGVGDGDGDWAKRLGRLKVDGKDGERVVMEVGMIANGGEAASGEVVGDKLAGYPQGLSELDKRLALLEGMIGPPDTGGEQSPGPLLPTLSKLSNLLTLLTQPRHLDSISRRIKLLLVDLDRAASTSTSSRRPPPSNPNPQQTNATTTTTFTLTPSEYSQLTELFSLLPRLDPLLPIIPPLLMRLRSLGMLHNQAGEVLGGLKRLEEGGKREEEELRELRGVVEGVKEGLGVMVEGVRKNWEGLEARLRGVEERMKVLNAS